MPEVEVGRVTEYFAHPVVAGVDLSAPLQLGEQIHIKGHTTDLYLTVESMQVDNQAVIEALPGQALGIKVSERVRRGDLVFKVVD